MPRTGKPGEIAVLSMFASVLRKANIPSKRDDPYIVFEYKGRKWRVQHFHSAQKGVPIKGKEHNMDLVIWSDNDYVAYVEVKDQSRDLRPHLSREFVGRVLWKDVDDALFVSKSSTINRWQILDRYSIRNTNHLLEAKHAGVEYREWPEVVVKDFIENDLGQCKVQTACDDILPSRKEKTISLMRKHKNFNGFGFRFVDTRGSKPKYYYLSDENCVIHALYAIFIQDDELLGVFKRDAPLNLANVYEIYASSVDLGLDTTICICPGFKTRSSAHLFYEMKLLQTTESDISPKVAVEIDTLPLYQWEKSATYPISELIVATEQNMPPCINKALGGVPDGLFETAVFLQTVFKACSISFDERGFSENCWKKIQEFWLGYEPSKTKKDTFQKVRAGVSSASGRKIGPATISCESDSSSVKGPKTLDKLFHLELCTPDHICSRMKPQEIYEYIRLNLRHAQQHKLDLMEFF